nr:MAG TPA: hypothetical protein [Bacteriophage sp.]
MIDLSSFIELIGNIKVLIDQGGIIIDLGNE